MRGKTGIARFSTWFSPNFNLSANYNLARPGRPCGAVTVLGPVPAAMRCGPSHSGCAEHCRRRTGLWHGRLGGGGGPSWLGWRPFRLHKRNLRAAGCRPTANRGTIIRDYVYFNRLYAIFHDYFRLYVIILLQHPNDYTRLLHYLTKDDYFTYFTTIISLIFSAYIIAIIAIIHDYVHFLLQAITHMIYLRWIIAIIFFGANYVHYVHYRTIIQILFLYDVLANLRRLDGTIETHGNTAFRLICLLPRNKYLLCYTDYIILIICIIRITAGSSRTWTGRPRVDGQEEVHSPEAW